MKSELEKTHDSIRLSGITATRHLHVYMSADDSTADAYGIADRLLLFAYTKKHLRRLSIIKNTETEQKQLFAVVPFSYLTDLDILLYEHSPVAYQAAPRAVHAQSNRSLR